MSVGSLIDKYCMRYHEIIKKSLYVCRPLINTNDIKTWASTQGFASTLDNDLHVTIAFSKEPVAWHQFDRQRNRLTVRGGQRGVKPLGDKGAVVLSFSARLLHERWNEFCAGGARWDHDGYQPHVTISYATDIDLGSVDPYDGDLVFGPEKFSVVDDDWAGKIDEKPSHP